MREPEQTEDSVAAVMRDLDLLTSAACAGCGSRICGHEALMSRMLGYKAAPRCWPCLASNVGQPALELRDHLQAHASHRDCYRAGWEEASRREGCADLLRPSCLSTPPRTREPAAPQAEAQQVRPSAAPDAEWDAGPMGCGDLVLELRLRLHALPSGTTMKVRATDPGAPEDIPAWCRLTGNKLLRQLHPQYWIQRKES